MSSDLTFITNEAGNTLRERLAALLAHTRRALQDAKQRELAPMSHAEIRDAVPHMILDELERSEDTPRRATARS